MSQPITNKLDLQLIEQGYGSFSLLEINNLVMSLANRTNMAITDINEEEILNHHKEIKAQYISNKCEQSILEGFISTINGHTYRTNRDDQINLIGRYNEVKEDINIQTVRHKTEDVGYIDHPRDEFIAVYKEAFNHKEQKLFKKDDLERQIYACTTHDEIEAIVW